jgi:hypothetical protein
LKKPSDSPRAGTIASIGRKKSEDLLSRLPVQQTLFRKMQTFLAGVATGPSGETLPWQTPIDRSEFLRVVSFRAYPRRPPSLVAARSTTKTFEPFGMAHTSVLLVDDDYELGQMLTEYLSAEAFTVITAADGAAALELAGKEF